MKHLLLTGGWISVFPVAVYAQTASQVVQPNYAPAVIGRAGQGISLPASTGLQTPEGAETLTVVPSGVDVENGLPDLASETSSINARLKGRRVTGADLFAAARDLEVAYARAGYILARVVLPQQTLMAGHPLRLLVVQGHIGNVDTSGVDEAARPRVAAIVDTLSGQPNPSRTEIERRLLLAGDTPGLVLRSTLKAGEKPGTADLILEGKSKPFVFSVTADNSTSQSLGRGTLGLGLDANNLLGFGEVGYFRLNGYPAAHGNFWNGDPRNRQMVAGATLPLGTDGWWLNVEALDSRTHPTSSLAYSMPDHYQRLSTRTGWSWLRSRDMNAGTSIAYDVTDETQKIDLGGDQSDFSKDQLRVVRLDQTFDMVTGHGAAISADATLSFGLDGFGARTGTDELPLSRSGSQPDFTKLTVSGRYTGSFAEGGIGLIVAGTAQTAFGDALASSEQLGIGGFNWLSAFDNSALQGDTAAAVRSEISFPKLLGARPFDTFSVGVTPYIFGAVGVLSLAEPTALEDGFSRVGALGVGVNIALSQPKSSRTTGMSVEYAHGAGSGDLRDNRINVSLGLRF